jgi:hypothetical protein
MAVAYDIKAHPTVYGARQFRSRLEAKWASFFDLCGWQFEYEPFDLEGWAPDFLLKGDTNVLVEVKPISAPDKDTQKKMERAATAAGWDGDLLLVGVAPLFEMDYGPYHSPALGWLGEGGLWAGERDGVPFKGYGWGRASACQIAPAEIDFIHDSISYSTRIYGRNFKSARWEDDSDWLKRAWDRAANRVQWHKK